MTEKKLIITAALCGAATSKAQTPHVPITPDEIAYDAVNAVKAGAAMLHIHARDANGKNSMETSVFTNVVKKIRAALNKEKLDVVLNLTASGSGWTDDLRVAHLPVLLPEMCSFDAGSMNWAHSYVFINTPEFLERLGTVTQELNIKPELEIFDTGMMGIVDHYLKKGFLKTPLHYQFVLGVAGGMPGNIESLCILLSKMQPNSTWSITGIGNSHMPSMLAGLSAGCTGLRVGLEDNIYLKKGVYATNAQLVERAVQLGKLAGREIATAEDARKILGVVKKV